METTTILALLFAGVAMGFINNIAGAAGVFGLFALESCAGLDTQTANASLRVSAFMVGLMGVIGFWSRGHRVPRRIWWLSLLTLPGTVLGCYLAIELPIWVYRSTLAAALVLVLVQQWRARGMPAAKDQPPTPRWLDALIFSGIGLYMGFVQIGFGLICILLLVAFYTNDLLQVNAAKMALAFVTATTSVGSFAVADKIAWSPALISALGCGIGSFAAGRWSVGQGHSRVRALVLVICIASLVRLAWQIVRL